jgi:hypothetical protein
MAVQSGRRTALARFEFEAGKANEGTKILMIEWEDDDLTRSSSEDRSDAGYQRVVRRQARR